jgi:hypothetical protein
MRNAEEEIFLHSRQLYFLAKRTKSLNTAPRKQGKKNKPFSDDHFPTLMQFMNELFLLSLRNHRVGILQVNIFDAMLKDFIVQINKQVRPPYELEKNIYDKDDENVNSPHGNKL